MACHVDVARIGEIGTFRGGVAMDSFHHNGQGEITSTADENRCNGHAAI